MKKLFSVLVLIVTVSAQASIPTVEGLFRNGANPDPQGDFVLLTLSVEEVLPEKPIGTDEELPPIAEEVVEEISEPQVPKKGAVKYVFSTAKENTTQFLQVKYAKPTFDNSDVLESFYERNLVSTLGKDPNFRRSLFNSVLMMMVLNDSRAIINALKQRAPNLPSHDEILNKEKLDLLKRQKAYLEAIKEDKDLVNELVDPLKPEDPQEAKKVAQILKEPMYLRSGHVVMMRKNKNFLWKVESGPVKAFFDIENHFIRQLVVEDPAGPIEVLFGERILFDGIHKLPKIVTIREADGRQFKIQILNMNAFSNTGEDLFARAKDYRDLAAKNRSLIEKRPATQAPASEATFHFPFLY